jgi:hypothetical protein
VVCIADRADFPLATQRALCRKGSLRTISAAHPFAPRRESAYSFRQIGVLDVPEPKQPLSDTEKQARRARQAQRDAEAIAYMKAKLLRELSPAEMVAQANANGTLEDLRKALESEAS